MLRRTPIWPTDLGGATELASGDPLKGSLTEVRGAETARPACRGAEEREREPP